MDPVTWFWNLMVSIWTWFWPIVGQIYRWCVTPSPAWWVVVIVFAVIGFVGTIFNKEFQYKGNVFIRALKRVLAAIGMAVWSPVAMGIAAVGFPSLAFFAVWFDVLVIGGLLVAFYAWPVWWIFFS